ncbi:peptidyl-prolyl cis-trans isomerase FKBP16-1, chloroplastic isoform X2 [Diospyros lotus]|uniref:peptidyl-prolyl cis-trans isomerase FKBP16-1, chloroplastic isoform X2 n=1 Tax=Diospyros lotus TaxID=55363 RepID=UPI0022504D4C|nr:peptidyl-prolyl cis-trans isomerase FKBP16-1, chloroplastic isoform X2 [Diospyros lotus]
MESPILRTPIPLPTAFRYPSSVRNEQSKIALAKNSDSTCHALSAGKVTRRSLLHFLLFSSISQQVYPVHSAPMQATKEAEVIRTQKLTSGVRIQGKIKYYASEKFSNRAFRGSCHHVDIVEGEGPEAREGSLVEVNYVCRRSNGYFVHSTVDQFGGENAPVILPLDEKRVSSVILHLGIIKGLKEVLVGMKVGGKRRALIPPSAGYVNENLKPIPEEFGPRRSLLSHANEPLIFEVQLLKVL